MRVEAHLTWLTLVFACAEEAPAHTTARELAPAAELWAVTDEPAPSPSEPEAPFVEATHPAEAEPAEQPEQPPPSDMGPAPRSHAGIRVTGAVRVSGVGEESRVARAFGERSAAFFRCYQRHVGNADFVEGELTLRVTLAEDGATTAADVVRDTLGDGDVNACVRREAVRMRHSTGGAGAFDVTLDFSQPSDPSI